MIIKLIPETDAEKETLQEVEHHHVKDFMIFGNKQDADGDLIDYFDWRGPYKFLISNLAWFLTEVKREYAVRQNAMGEIPKMSLAPAPGSQRADLKIIPSNIDDGEEKATEVDASVVGEDDNGTNDGDE